MTKNGRMLNLSDFIDIPDRNIYETANDFQKIIDQMDSYHANPFCMTITDLHDNSIDIGDRYDGSTKRAISFVSNNYLGLNCNNEVKKKALETMQKYGVGLCAASPIGGNTWMHEELEKTISELHGQEAAILYNSGYSANIGVYQTLLNKFDLAIVDAYVHASVYDGLKNNTNIKICAHNDVSCLERILRRTHGKYRNIVIIVDGVYSQDGDLSPLDDICKVAKTYNSFIFVDDAHGVGVLGRAGKGTCSYFGVESDVDLITGTFSKSIGTNGGYATGSRQLIKYLKHSSRSNTFSVSLPLHSVAAAKKAIEIFTDEPQIINKLWDNANYLKSKLTNLGFDIGNSQSPITPIMIRDDKKALLVARELFKMGIYVIPAIYPAVKTNNSRFRISVTTLHSKSDFDYLCDSLLALNGKFKIIKDKGE